MKYCLPMARAALTCLGRWRWATAFSVALGVGLAACGDSSPQSQIILTIVRVEERNVEGSWIPVAGADVDYQIWGSKPNASADGLLQFEFQDVTDEAGLSVVAQDAGDKRPSHLGQVFAEAGHPDGRTGFIRKRFEAEFDFMAWFETFWSEPLEVDSIVDAICATADDFDRCGDYLQDRELVAWGRGILIRIR